MKKAGLLLFLLAFFVASLQAQKKTSRQIMAEIAETHLSPYAKATANVILGTTIFSDAVVEDYPSNRVNAKKVIAEHTLTLPEGLNNVGELELVVKEKKGENIYNIFVTQEKILKDSSIVIGAKKRALIMLVSAIADAYMPTQIKIKSQKGKVRLATLDAKIISCWENGLINQQATDPHVVAIAIDEATPLSEKSFQRIDPMQWLWESYTIKLEIVKED